MAVILRVFISFSSVLRVLNFAFSETSFVNRYGHYRCTAYHTNGGRKTCGCINHHICLAIFFSISCIITQNYLNYFNYIRRSLLAPDISLFHFESIFSITFKFNSYLYTFDPECSNNGTIPRLTWHFVR